MIYDSQLLFSDAQALTASAASTNIIDLATARNVAVGRPLYYFIQTTVNADYTSTNETYAAAFQTDDNEAFGSPSYNYTLPDVNQANLITTKLLVGMLPLALLKERYLRMYWTLGGTTPSVTVRAGLALDVPTFDMYRSGYSISG